MKPERTIVYLHGFASSAQGTKAIHFQDTLEEHPEVRFLALDFHPTPRDFEFSTVTGMVNRLRQYLLDHRLCQVDLICSSLGALVGLHYAYRFGGIGRMLLLAPVLRYRPVIDRSMVEVWKGTGTMNVFHYAFEREIPLRYDFHSDGCRYLSTITPPTKTVIIHGRRDETVPIEESQGYAAKFPDQVRLVFVDSGHSLNEHLASIVEQVRRFLLCA